MVAYDLRPGQWRQKVDETEVISGYIWISKPAWATDDFVFL